MENINWILTIKIIAYWFLWLGIIYILARRGFKKTSYNWKSYQDFTIIGALFSIMKSITLYSPIIAIIGYLTYLLFKP